MEIIIFIIIAVVASGYVYIRNWFLSYKQKKVIKIFEDNEKKYGVKLKATAAHTVNFLNEDLISFWKDTFKAGWFDLASHSMDHAFAYNEGVDIERRRKDAKDSKEALERISKVFGIVAVTRAAVCEKNMEDINCFI